MTIDLDEKRFDRAGARISSHDGTRRCGKRSSGPAALRKACLDRRQRGTPMAAHS